ncbi:MAG: galactokinase [Clostridia bacterium]|nr:galactokinase [Clostridia bacterium]
MENFASYFGKNPSLLVSAAGRVNLIGEHIDYCGGKVLPISLNLSSKVYSLKNNTNKINIAFKGIKDILTLDIDNIENYKNVKIGTCQAGVFYVLKDMGYTLCGLDIYVDCDIPFGAGLSSSAGLEASAMITMLEQNGYNYSLTDVALWCQRAEHEYCFVMCGIMDQFASCNGKKDKAMLLDCKKVECEYIDCDFGDYSLLVCSCNKPHELVKSEYNTRLKEVNKGLSILKTKVDIECLADLEIDDFENYKELLPNIIKNRVSHVVYECNRVKQAVNKLSNKDIKGFGELLNESHYSLRDNYEVTGMELDTLTDLMRNFNGCIGARMTGAGFGGSCICLVEKGKEEQLKQHCINEYTKIIGYPPTFYDTTIEDGIVIKKL